tara:strand:- start:1935 stop:2270 length:336 start_codon:yes stop_codon:yes gene_type:complete
MTIRYKSETFDLTTTNITTVLTCPADATIIIKNVQAVHDTASNVDTDLFIKKSGASSVQIGHVVLNKSTDNLIKESLNLEASDIIELQVDTANEVSGAISYALIDRSQENG